MFRSTIFKQKIYYRNPQNQNQDKKVGCKFVAMARIWTSNKKGYFL